MKNLKNNKMLLGIGITFLLLATVSMSYAWFSATVTRENSHDQIVKTGTLELTYTDGPEIKLENVRPGKTLTKEVSVKNTGTLDAEYNLVWQELNNEITNDEMVISITCSIKTDKDAPGEACPELAETPISGNVLIEGATIESGYTHNYVITITFKELNKDQNYNQGKNFSGVLGVNEYKDTTPEPIYCTYDGEMTQGATYTKGEYTYTYSSSNNGWRVTLTSMSSTGPITEAPCSYVNEVPITSTYQMFFGSHVSSIDLTDFDTSNVTDMRGMFASTTATEIKGLENFDTSKVTMMDSMFGSSPATSLNLSNFDTSNVTSMSYMLAGTEAREIIGLDKFDTSNVTNMEGMFEDSKITTLDLSSFDTSKVTNMYVMFRNIAATEIKGLEKFNTSNVTIMNSMFFETSLTTLDLSGFDTSNVTDMRKMFENSDKLKTIYVSDKFVTDKVTNSTSMFNGATNLVGGSGTTYDSTKVDKTYARIDGGTSSPGYFTKK